MKTTSILAALLLLLCLKPCSAVDQAGASRHTVRIEVLIQPSPQQNLMSRRWTPVFQQLSQPVTFRSGRTGEQVSLFETETAGRKGVRVIGLLNKDGTIRFPGKTLSTLQPEAVKKWLTRLRTHGARGPADEDPTWGLSTENFKRVLSLLASPVNKAVDAQTVTSAIESLNLSSEFSIRFTDKARLKAARAASRIGDVVPDCSKLSKGSALAVVLAQFGLGFRPKLKGKDQYVLEIDVGDEGDNLYPIGWKNEAPIVLVVKNLTKRFDVALDNQNLNLVIQLLAKKLELPFAYASSDLVEAKLNPDDLKYSRNSGKTSAYRLIQSIETRHRIGIGFRTDEAGQVFLWVTTEENEKSFDRRFQHVKVKTP